MKTPTMKKAIKDENDLKDDDIFSDMLNTNVEQSMIINKLFGSSGSCSSQSFVTPVKKVYNEFINILYINIVVPGMGEKVITI